MIYKRYELSQSLNGDKIVHIARNALGNVVFRESSEQKLKKAIDRSIEERQRQEDLEEKKKLAKATTKAQKRGLFAPPPEPIEEETEPAVEEVLVPPQEPRTTRGPDGKFIGKSQFEQEEPKKKGFWDRLK